MHDDRVYYVVVSWSLESGSLDLEFESLSPLFSLYYFWDDIFGCRSPRFWYGER